MKPTNFFQDYHNDSRENNNNLVKSTLSLSDMCDERITNVANFKIIDIMVFLFTNGCHW